MTPYSPNNNAKYQMSFTTGGLFLQESVEMASLFLQTGNWDMVKEKVISENLLQTRTSSSAKRICREIIDRLKRLSQSELDLLVKGNGQEQRYLLWIAVCRRYKFISEFATEVIQEHLLTMETRLSLQEFDAFFESKAALDSRLETVKPSTRKKLRQVLYRILREAGIIDQDGTIIPAILPESFKGKILPEDARCLPAAGYITHGSQEND